MALEHPIYWVLDADLREVQLSDSDPFKRMLIWGTWLRDHEQDRIVAQEYVGKDWISTVFLGLDHNYGRGHRPLIYETMIFYAEKETELVERYSTWAEAAEGHRKAVEVLKANP